LEEKMIKAKPEVLAMIIEKYTASPKKRDENLEDYICRPDKKRVKEEQLDLVGRWGYFKEEEGEDD
jgi:hypothetical protein